MVIGVHIVCDVDPRKTHAKTTSLIFIMSLVLFVGEAHELLQ